MRNNDGILNASWGCLPTLFPHTQYNLLELCPDEKKVADEEPFRDGVDPCLGRAGFVASWHRYHQSAHHANAIALGSAGCGGLD
mmetsp:Transcript_14499/g.31200  ORF Transcript_14499/g.31200 Transcript_14499/m.31200 type:complete len:84 (-) Transcript_14499:26-277(-)